MNQDTENSTIDSDVMKEIENIIMNTLTLKGIKEITKVAYTKESTLCK